VFTARYGLGLYIWLLTQLVPDPRMSSLDAPTRRCEIYGGRNVAVTGFLKLFVSELQAGESCEPACKALLFSCTEDYRREKCLYVVFV